MFLNIISVLIAMQNKCPCLNQAFNLIADWSTPTKRTSRAFICSLTKLSSSAQCKFHTLSFGLRINSFLSAKIITIENFFNIQRWIFLDGNNKSKNYWKSQLKLRKRRQINAKTMVGNILIHKKLNWKSSLTVSQFDSTIAVTSFFFFAILVRFCHLFALRRCNYFLRLFFTA